LLLLSLLLFVVSIVGLCTPGLGIHYVCEPRGDQQSVVNAFFGYGNLEMYADKFSPGERISVSMRTWLSSGGVTWSWMTTIRILSSRNLHTWSLHTNSSTFGIGAFAFWIPFVVSDSFRFFRLAVLLSSRRARTGYCGNCGYDLRRYPGPVSGVRDQPGYSRHKRLKNVPRGDRYRTCLWLSPRACL